MKLFITALIMGAALQGCSSFNETTESGPQSKLFIGKYEKVWRAAQVALEKYPLKINNMDKGVLETSRVKLYEHWQPPTQKFKNPNGITYRLKLKLYKGVSKGREAVKVKITKKMELRKGFFAEPEDLNSDSFEEQALLYSIGQEIKVDKLLDREQQKTQR